MVRIRCELSHTIKNEIKAIFFNLDLQKKLANLCVTFKCLTEHIIILTKHWKIVQTDVRSCFSASNE
jgi:hypothetical protein